MRFLLVAISLMIACPAVADDVTLKNRWDLRGFYYAVGATMTEGLPGNSVALNLLSENSVQVDSQAIPAGATLEAAYLYWSGARETPDTTVELRNPSASNWLGITAQEQDCYSDFDGRTNSLSKRFYTCRADVTQLMSNDWAQGEYTVRGVHSVILPNNKFSCTSDTQCYQAANDALAGTKVLTSCNAEDNGKLCACDNGKCTFEQNTIGHASFSLIFVYSDPNQDQIRTIFLYDGMEAFIQKTVSFKLDDVLTNTPPQGQFNVGQLTYYIVEGDNNNVSTYASPECDQTKKQDNPGERVQLAWGTVNDEGISLYDAPTELTNAANTICDDPFNGTTGVGVDIETYDLDVPAGKTVARLDVSSPGLESVNNYYPEEQCNGVNATTCGPGHVCRCTEGQSQNCLKWRCVDDWSEDGIGVAYVVLGFDSFVPELVGAQKTHAMIDKVPKGQLDGIDSPGDVVQYVMEVTNSAAATADAIGFKIVDELPLGLRFVGWNGDASKAQLSFTGLANSSNKDGLYDVTIDVIEVTNAEGETTGETQDVVTIDLSETSPLLIGESIEVAFQAEIDPMYPWLAPGGSLTNTVRFEATGIDPVLATSQPVQVQLVDTDNDNVNDHEDNCPLTGPADQTDTDGDGIGDLCDPDQDGDGKLNGVDACPLKKSYWEGKDLDDGDADNDGLPLQEEIYYGSDPCNDDTDNDGLEDGKEVNTYSSDPTLCDTDGDGLPDGLEAGVTLETRPDDTELTAPVDGECGFKADADPDTMTDPSKADTDGGGVSDGDEDPNGDGLYDPYATGVDDNGVDMTELDPNNPYDDFKVSGGSRLINCNTTDRSSWAPIVLIVSLLAGLLLWRRRASVLMLLLAGMMTFPSSSQAQEEVNYNTLRYVGNSKGIIVTEAGELEPPMDFSVGIAANYGHRPLVLRHAKTGDPLDKDLVEQRLGVDLNFAMSFASWFETALNIPMIPYQKGNDPLTGEEVPSFALGDITLTPKFRIAGSRRGGGFLSLLLPVTFPSGKAMKGSYAQGEGFSFRPTIAMSAGEAVVWAMNLGTVIREPGEPLGQVHGYEFYFSMGFEFAFIENTSFLMIDGYGATQFDDFFKRQETTPVEVLMAYKHRFRKFYVTVGGGSGLTRGNGVPEWRVLMNFGYASELLDKDGDRIGDDDDQCPSDPEDYDRFEDLDGCPEPDNDQDGILDRKDKCPNEKEDRDGFEDSDGCPEDDNDEDGILDVDDECPLKAEDKDDFKDEDGCPEDDNDEDGILDTKDKCPMDPEDLDGWQDQDGCPDPDNDNDRVLDTADKCPNEPENYNEYKDEDGCPDVVFTCKEFIIPEKVFFRTRSYRIKKKSYALLDVVAETILAHPEAAKLEIQGHTDVRGSRKSNQRLSERRAQSVVKYLIKRGVTPDRLTFKGYGFDAPLEPGKTTKEYWDQNRRVQFIVVTLDPTKSERCRR